MLIEYANLITFFINRLPISPPLRIHLLVHFPIYPRILIGLISNPFTKCMKTIKYSKSTYQGVIPGVEVQPASK